jgi:hypothetical protein
MSHQNSKVSRSCELGQLAGVACNRHLVRARQVGECRPAHQCAVERLARERDRDVRLGDRRHVVEDGVLEHERVVPPEVGERQVDGDVLAGGLRTVQPDGRTSAARIGLVAGATGVGQSIGR